MKTKVFKPLLCLCAAMLAVASTSCDSEDPFNTKNTLTDYLRVKNVSAHYVGKVVVVDFDIENKSKKDFNDLSLRIYEALADGNSYYYRRISMGEGQEYSWQGIDNVTIARGETRSMRVRIEGEGLLSVAKNISIKLTGESKQMGTLDDDAITFKSNITDSRRSANTIWANDDNISFSTPVVERDGNDLYATVRITNNTGINLGNVELYASEPDNGNGSSFYSRYLIVDNNSGWQGTDLTINRGETREVTLRVPDFFEKSARCLNATVEMSSNYYTFADDAFYFVSVNVN